MNLDKKSTSKMFALIDLTLFIGLLALLFYILIAVAVLPVTLYGLSYALLVTAIVLLCIWVLFKFILILGCSDGDYRWRRREIIVGNSYGGNGYGDRVPGIGVVA